jgi:hypothetical protein
LGVYPDQFQIEAMLGRDLRERLGVRGRYFLSVATDFPHKNAHNLLVAYGEFRSRWRGDLEPPALILIGNQVASRLGAYNRLACDCPEGVIYCGTVSQKELAALYQGAEALVYPSVYEGFGLPLLEAMVVGTPVISLPIASIPEVGGDAVLFPDGMAPRDLAVALRRLCDDRELRDVLIARGQARAELFRWERTAQLTVDVYKSVLSRPSERSLRARRYLLEVFPGWTDHVHGRRQVLEANYQEVSRRKEELEANYQEVSRRKEELEANYQEVSHHNADLSAEASRLKASLVQLQQGLEELEQEHSALQETVAHLDASHSEQHRLLTTITSGTVWQFLQAIHHVRNVVAPHGSLRGRLVKISWVLPRWIVRYGLLPLMRAASPAHTN